MKKGKRELQLERDIKGLILILKDNIEEGIIHRNYVIEKLDRILAGTMNFHPSIKSSLENDGYDFDW